MSAKQTTLGKDGLPEGWEERDYCFEALFDLSGLAALHCDGKGAFPKEWMHERPGFLTFHEAVADEGVERGYITLATERACNLSFDEDSIFLRINDMVRNGAGWQEVEAFVSGCLSSANVDMNCQIGQEYLSDLMSLAQTGVRWMGRRWELGIDA